MDVWSAGVVMYVSMSGYFPFSEESDIFEQIINESINFSDHPWPSISEEGYFVYSKI